MLNKFKAWYGGLAVALSVVTGAFFTFNGAKPTETRIRTAHLEIPPQYTEYVETLFNKGAHLEGDEEYVRFMGITDGMVDVDVTYECVFNANTFEFELLVSTGQDGDSDIVQGFINDYGGLDAPVTVEGEERYISDYKDVEKLDDLLLAEWEGRTLDDVLFGWFVRIVVVIVVYVIVAQTAEQIRADSNYTYNQRLERDGRGVNLGNYITDQEEVSRSGYNSGNYRFGFTTFEEVGCEVAAVYNAMIAMNAEELLSETIYKFEKWAIEISVGWGKLGSNPRQINKYLDRRGFSYSKYTDYDAFENAVNVAPSDAHIIMSRWNDPITDGLHTFYIQKITNNVYYSYNWNYEDDYVDKTSISAFNDGSGFIVGYIVYE